MDQNKIKESISTKAFEIMASNIGIKSNIVSPDDGIDLRLNRTNVLNDQLIFDEEEIIDVQVKSTTTTHISLTDNSVKYDLRLSNFNKLVHMRNTRVYIPYYLILFIFPPDGNATISIEDQHLSVYNTAYWWRPISGTELIMNKPKNYKKRISIPIENKLEIQTLNELLDEIKL